MKVTLGLIPLFLLALSPSLAQSRPPCSGSNGKPCPPDPKTRWCADESIGPNLTIEESARIRGSLFYENGSRVLDKDVWVRVSDPATKKMLYSARLDDQGQFDLGEVPRGQFRFSSVLAGHGVYYRLSKAGQPANLSCANDKECWLNIVIWWKQVGYPIVACPPR
jgi:hypothetical protein